MEMQDGNFQTIMSTWRRMSGEEIESSAIVSMSGDSNEYDVHKKKEEDSHLLVPSVSEKSKLPVAAIATAEVATATVDLPPAIVGEASPEEKQELIKNDSDEAKDGAGDAEKDKKYSDYLENNLDTASKSDNKWENDKLGDKDKVDSVYLRPPPPHKAHSTASTPEEEDCGIKCLYYTLQCCDCVLM
ncbi:uncharacterized protein LOC131848574 [Achroia grisella]|uniref:uncharacterized protein LOC131848574 n=1 Tax=Achroia grisella TaxID=688607 RepID=UPI0027D23AEA|nr:uncharacterized protein LOC131848574 [Achroia grisella]